MNIVRIISLLVTLTIVKIYCIEFSAQTPPYTILTTSADAAPGIVVMAPVQSANQIFICALDEDAELVFNAHSPVRGFIFEPWGEDEFVFYNYSIRKWVTIDHNLTPTDTLGLSLVPETDYHDVHRFEDGSYLFVVNEFVEMDLSSYGGFEDAEVISPVMMHMDVDENIIREWHGLDHIPVNASSILNFQQVDYLHWNAFDIDSFGGVLMSFRNISTIVRLNPADWSIDWQLGEYGNDFQIDDPDWGSFLKQHDVNDIGGNRILLFDNNLSSGNQPGYSRVVEYEVDTVEMTASRVWSYSHPEEVYAPAQGSVQRLENGNTLIAWGNANAGQGQGTLVTEINDQGEFVWEIEFGTYFTVYRARKIPTSEVLGCMDINALNYDNGVLVDDGSCYYGVDYDGDGMLDSEGDCDDFNASIYLGAPEIPNDGIDQDCDGSDLIFIPGCTNLEASNFNPSATVDDGSCLFSIVLKVDMFLHGGGASLVTELGNIDGEPINFGVYKFEIQIPEGEFNYRFMDENSIQELNERTILINSPISVDVVCFNSEVNCPGCINPEFSEFNPYAISDISMCQTAADLGCTYDNALNYDSTANIDDGSCLFAESSGDNCLGDFNLDGTIGTSDLLIILMEWGTICF
jgi:hypothetical protein